jgi:hypothetical protein
MGAGNLPVYASADPIRQFKMLSTVASDTDSVDFRHSYIVNQDSQNPVLQLVIFGLEPHLPSLPSQVFLACCD